MSGGLNKKFLKDPQTFLAKNFIMASAKKSGMTNVDLKVAVDPYVVLKDRDSWGFSSTKIPCYYLKAQQNMVSGQHTLLIPQRIKFIFTDLITGCQFLAYGSAHAPQIEHNNNTSGKAVDFGVRRQRAGRMQCLAELTPGVNYSREQATQEQCSVTGIRQSDGRWEFWLQKISFDKRITLSQM